MTDSDGNEIGKIFVGGLSQATNDDKLRIYFSQLGEIDDSVVMMDNKTGRSRGFGYVKYRNPESVDLVLHSKPHIIDLKEVDVKQCNVNMKGKNRRSLKIFVGGISLEHDAESIKSFFEQFGAVTDINLMMDQSKLRHRGFAFVGFEDENIVKKLISLHFVNISSKQVEIKAMEPPNFTKKFQTANEYNVSVSNCLNGSFSVPEQSMNLPGAFISNCATPSLWRPSVVQYPQAMVWSTQMPTSGWMGSPQPWNNQWGNQCEHGQWPGMNWTCPSTWYQQVASPTMWPSQPPNWVPMNVANQASKSHIYAPPPIYQTIEHPDTLLQSWPGEAPVIPQKVSSTMTTSWGNHDNDLDSKANSSENSKTPSARVPPNTCCGSVSSGINQSNNLNGNLSSRDYSGWFYGSNKEVINSNIAVPLNSVDSHSPGGGAGDYNRNQSQDSCFSFYATRN